MGEWVHLLEQTSVEIIGPGERRNAQQGRSADEQKWGHRFCGGGVCVRSKQVNASAFKNKCVVNFMGCGMGSDRKRILRGSNEGVHVIRGNRRQRLWSTFSVYGVGLGG